MDSTQFQNFVGEIASGEKVKRTADQLACILRLIFYSGIKKAEIIELAVRDVIDSRDNILQRIDDLNAVIPGNSRAALRDYLRTPKDRKPHLLKRGAHLFPGYRNTKKLDRDLKAVGADYMDILHSGVRHSYTELVDRGLERTKALSATAELFRYDVKTVEKILLGKTAPAGARDDVGRRVMELSEKALHLKPEDPKALDEADKIIRELEIMLQQAKEHSKDQLEGVIPLIQDMLKPVFSAKQKIDNEKSGDSNSRNPRPDLLRLIRSINSISMKKKSFDNR